VPHIDQNGFLNDIWSMSKTVKSKASTTVRRTTHSGQFIGRTKEGFLVPKPDFKPSSFTVRELQEAVQAAKRRQTAARAG
jgi:hypothetical protein